jgi:hypothetical protein
MPFTVQIEFSGLCLFLKHKNGREVGVVMPDARTPTNGEMPTHKDETKAVPHVGYLRYDLADMVPSVVQAATPPLVPSAPNSYAGPRFEVVHRFNRETLDLGFGSDDGIATDELALPNFHRISKRLTLTPGLFAASPPEILLMRMKLQGGRFSSHSGGSNWTFPSTANGKRAYQGQFASVTTWTSPPIDKPALTLTLTPFDGGEPTAVTLRPVDDVVRLKICNLCAENPLEWRELWLRVIVGNEDKDFKWLYRLMGNYEKVTKTDDGRHHFPVPVLDRRHMVAGEEQDCAGGMLEVDTF